RARVPPLRPDLQGRGPAAALRPASRIRRHAPPQSCPLPSVIRTPPPGSDAAILIRTAGPDNPNMRDLHSPSDARRDLPRALDVCPHLLLERLGAVEAALAAQPLDELERQRLAVEVAVEVEDVGLDQLAATGVERGPHTDRDGARATVGETGVDAVAGVGQRLLRHEVGRRE